MGQAGVRSRLNQHYYGLDDPLANSMLTGSWGKGLAVRSRRDIDVMFLLPDTVLSRFNQRVGNRQSQILQEVRSVLSVAYGLQTEMRGDQQAVVVRFSTTPVDVVPGFRARYGQVWICDTRYGGTYRLADPVMEMDSLNTSDARHQGVTRIIIRAIKQWQRHCNAPLRSFQVERLVIEFMHTQSGVYFWPDSLVRDFFGWLITRPSASIIMPGTLEVVALGNAWRSRAETAWRNACIACDHERAGQNLEAGAAWQKVFGTMIPLVA
nr:hypothetical protein [Brevundimonas sp.]